MVSSVMHPPPADREGRDDDEDLVDRHQPVETAIRSDACGAGDHAEYDRDDDVPEEEHPVLYAGRASREGRVLPERYEIGVHGASRCGGGDCVRMASLRYHPPAIPPALVSDIRPNQGPEVGPFSSQPGVLMNAIV